jgi:hypothetical protein
MGRKEAKFTPISGGPFIASCFSRGEETGYDGKKKA